MSCNGQIFDLLKVKSKIISATSNEGEKSPRTVVIEFPSFDQANSFYKSKEYQDAHSILKGYAERQHQIIEGA